MSLIGLNRRYSANILQIKKPVIPKSLESTGFVGDLGRIQTYNLLSRNQEGCYLLVTQFLPKQL